MAIADDLRKTFTDPTPLYFAAGTADLALQQARKVPELVEQLRAEAPARFEAVRRTDPKQVQVRAAARVKDVQESVQNVVSGVLGSLDTDLKKFSESAQGIALRGVGVAVEYAVKARETYERVAEHGEQTVRTWRGEDTTSSPAVEAVERSKPVVVRDEPTASSSAKSTTTGAKAAGAAGTKSAGSGRSTQASRTTSAGQTPAASASSATSTSSPSSTKSAASASSEAAKKTPAKKTTARRNGTSTRKTTPRDK